MLQFAGASMATLMFLLSAKRRIDERMLFTISFLFIKKSKGSRIEP